MNWNYNTLLTFTILIAVTKVFGKDLQQPNEIGVNSRIRGNNVCYGRDGRDGPPGPMGNDGRDGKDGKDGKDGRRGLSGENGKNGVDGKDGLTGKDGKPGKDGKDGLDGKNGKNGQDGRPGNNGKDGAPGKDASPKNWKECAWKSLNDGRDNGEIKNCSFKKRSYSTYLEVTVSSSMRIYGCNGCCKRWYVTFDGVECTPVPIDVAVYMANLDGKFGDLHRPRIIKGYCKIAKAGLVNVGFRLGNCHGYGNADAYTGWNSSTRIMVEEVEPPQE